MSLINPRNFLAPLTNAVNLATIIVIALLFGIYRLSGGGVNMSSRKPAAPAAVVKQVESAPAAALKDSEVDSRQARPQSARPPVGQDRVLGDLLDKQETSGTLRDPPKSRPPAKGSSLDDIARQLGVE